jgi:hypothetical protein
VQGSQCGPIPEGQVGGSSQQTPFVGPEHIDIGGKSRAHDAPNTPHSLSGSFVHDVATVHSFSALVDALPEARRRQSFQ